MAAATCRRHRRSISQRRYGEAQIHKALPHLAREAVSESVRGENSLPFTATSEKIKQIPLLRL